MNAPADNESSTRHKCLGCAGKAKRVEAVTLRSLVRENAREQLSTLEGFRFCPASGCDTVYSRAASGEAVGVKNVTVEVFQKSTNVDRLVCYCFGHSVRDVRADSVDRAILADVEDKCRSGLDRCETENPQGRCCLGNVRKMYHEGAPPRPEEHAMSEDPTSDCCSTPSVSEAPPPPALAARAAADEANPKAGRWAAGGAVVAALASSACCWLPLSLIALGVSAGGIGAFFEAYRFYFLGGTALLLGAGFYYVYLRKPTCAPGDACAVPNPRLVRLNKIMLWTATAFVVTFAAFPNYIGYVIGGGEAPVVEAADIPEAPRAPAAALVTHTYLVEGMSCAGCTVHIEETVAKVAGVQTVAVSYEDKLARVTFAPGAEIDEQLVIAAFDEAGFPAKRQGGQ